MSPRSCRVLSTPPADHPTDVLDLRAADRLAIGDYRERLQRGAGQLGNSYRELSLLDRRSEGPPGEYLVAAGQLDDLHRMAVEIVMLAQLLQRCAYIGE
jgi:hypothetical protein